MGLPLTKRFGFSKQSSEPMKCGEILLCKLEAMTQDQASKAIRAMSDEDLEAIGETDPKTTAYLKRLTDAELDALIAAGA
jgi:hypothetical protein